MKISVIVASYNSAKTIRDTFESILNQTYSDYEVIVKDGGSSDGTVEIIKEYELKFDGRLKWNSEPDLGIYDAMNKGIELSTGDVVGILNSDDFFSADSVLSRINGEFASNEDISAVYGDVRYVKADDTAKCVRYFSSRYYRPWMARLGFIVAHPSFYCRREVFCQYGLYDLDFKVSSDFEMVTRLLYVNRISAKYLDMDFVTMRTGGESNSGLESRKRVNRDIRLALKKHGIYSNQILQGLRYIWRIGEIVYTKLKY